MVDWKSKLYFGDNLNILREYVPDESVGLIYLDPAVQLQRDVQRTVPGGKRRGFRRADTRLRRYLALEHGVGARLPRRGDRRAHRIQ